MTAIRNAIHNLRLAGKYRYYRGKKYVTAETPMFSLRLDTSYAADVGQVLSLAKRIRRGKWEREFLKACFDHIKEDEIILEIGTWIGCYSVLLAKYMAPRGKVFGFEPDPAALRQCVINLYLNGVGNAFIFPTAISDKTSPLPLYTNRLFGNSGSSIFESNPVQNGADRAKIEVPGVTLDSVIKTLGVSPSSIKIDIEGAEDLALIGGAETVSKKGVKIFAEIHHDYLQRRGKSANDVLRQLADAGKTLYFASESEGSAYKPGDKMDPLRPITLANFHVIGI